MARDFLQAAIPEPVTLLGQRLHPFSLGHYILLERFKSPFLLGGQADVTDLFTAVLICCNKYDEFINLIKEDDLRNIVKRWAKRLGNFDVNDISQAFNVYVNDCFNNFPKYWYEETGGNSKKLGAPFTQSIKVRLMRSFSLSEEETLNRPLGLCIWDVATLMEQDGVIKINTKADDETANQKELFKEWLRDNPNLVQQFGAN